MIYVNQIDFQIFFWELALLDNPIDWIKKMKSILEK